VEVLLTPGIFLRLGENGSFRMITRRLVDTRLELLTGSAIVEADEIAKETNVTLAVRSATVTFAKAGLYRFDLEPARIKVFKGAANVEIGGQNVVVPGGKMLDLGGGAATLEKFNSEDTDSLDNWNQRRSQYVAMANVSAARYARENSLSLNGSAWGWNPYFGVYTFLPFSGRIWSPYGYAFWSPGTVEQVYYARQPMPSSFNGGGHGFPPSDASMAPSMNGRSAAMDSAPGRGSVSMGAAAAPAASPAGHGGPPGGGKGR
jgi:hypothetical protein